MRRFIIWDFDNTLALRPGGWTETMLEVSRRHAPGYDLQAEQIRPHIAGGFPWNFYETPHPHLASADAWWENLQPLLTNAYMQCGIEASLAGQLAFKLRDVYLEPEPWRVFDDTFSTLDFLSREGWQHILLTNHVPELMQIMNHLGFNGYFQAVFNSAQTGIEKPNPLAFKSVLDFIGGAEKIWMVGDNPKADILGAQAVGIPGILVHRDDPEQGIRFRQLADIIPLVKTPSTC